MGLTQCSPLMTFRRVKLIYHSLRHLHLYDSWCLLNHVNKTLFCATQSKISHIIVLFVHSDIIFYSAHINVTLIHSVTIRFVNFFFFFLINFCWTNVHFVEPLIAPVLDFVCPSSWVSKPEWISRLHSFLLACCDPEGHNWCNTCLFHQ